MCSFSNSIIVGKKEVINKSQSCYNLFSTFTIRWSQRKLDTSAKEKGKYLLLNILDGSEDLYNFSWELGLMLLCCMSS